MSKIVTTGKRFLKDDRWHDGNGPLSGHPGEWEPPMTDEEEMVAALSDPDAQPSTPEQLARMRRIPFARHVRMKLGLTREEFARRFGIPVELLRNWEQYRSEPDPAATSYLKVIACNPRAVADALQAAE